MSIGSGRIPLNAVITIADTDTDDKAIRASPQEAYESGKLRGSQLIQARRVIDLLFSQVVASARRQIEWLLQSDS